MATWLHAGLQDGGLTQYGLHKGLSNLGLFSGASLDLRFADTKSLADAVTGQSLVTFTRASSATYVGSDGLIKTATANLLLRSEEFDNASWQKFNSGVVAPVVTSNQSVAPSGVMTADKIELPAVNGAGFCSIVYQAPTQAFSTSHTFSCYLRGEVGGEKVWLEWTDNITRTRTLCTLTTSWQRFSLSYTTSASGAQYVIIGVDLRDPSQTATPAQTFYAWGAQLEQSSTVGEYIPTTSTINSAPRFDHNPTTGESLGLLVEEPRTNLLQRSEEFDNAYWTKNGSTISANSATAPDGLTTADKLVEDTSTGNHRVFALTPSQAASTAHTLSVYVKAAGRTIVRIELRDSLGGYAVQDFNLTTLAVTSAGSGTGTIFSIGNGWYRCTVTGTSSASGGVGNAIFWALAAAGSVSYTGDGTSGLLIWGAQLEAGASFTSYIPTTTATVTRSADVASITSTAFSSWFNAAQGTIYTQASTAEATGNPYVVAINDGTNNNRLELRRIGATNLAGCIMTTLGVTEAAPTVAGWTARTSGRVAAAYATNDVILAFNGTLSIRDTSANLPTVTQMTIGSTITTVGTNQPISRITYFPQRLPDSTLQTLTQ